jgi:hypothetical protein
MIKFYYLYISLAIFCFIQHGGGGSCAMAMNDDCDTLVKKGKCLSEENVGYVSAR